MLQTFSVLENTIDNVGNLPDSEVFSRPEFGSTSFSHLHGFGRDGLVREATDKLFATVQARCALAEVTLHQLENDHGRTVFIVSRWALTREMADLDAVAFWLDRVTGVKS